MTLNSEFNAQKINASYANLVENMPKIFERVEMTMKDFEPNPTDNETRIDHIQDFIRSNSKVHEQKFEMLLKTLADAQKTIKKIQKESQKHKNNHSKMLKLAAQKQSEITKINSNKNLQLQKLQALESTNKQKYDQEVTKLNSSVEKQLQKIKNAEIKCDKQIKQSLKDLAALDKDRLVLIFQTNEVFYNVMQNVAQNTLDLIPKISSFYQRNSIQDLMDAFIAKYKTDITTFTFKLTAPGAAQATPTEAENIFAEAKADLVQSGIPENADKELPKPDEEEKKEQ